MRSRQNFSVRTHMLMFLTLTIICAVRVIAEDAAKPIPEAWGTIKFRTLIGNMPGVPANLTISLKAADGSYEKNLNSSNNDIKRALANGRFSFSNVPAEITMHLEIVYVAPSGSKDRFFASYVFHYPKTVIPDKEAIKKAGFAGDFIITLEPAKIEAK